MKHSHCKCRRCRSEKRKGNVLGAFFHRGFGCYVSSYVSSARFAKGKRYRKANSNSMKKVNVSEQ